MSRRSSRLAKSILPASKKVCMSTMDIFKLPGTDVPVKLVDDLSREEVLEFPAFKVSLNLPSTNA
jgi:hypothetical protein